MRSDGAFRDFHTEATPSRNRQFVNDKCPDCAAPRLDLACALVRPQSSTGLLLRAGDLGGRRVASIVVRFGIARPQLYCPFQTHKRIFETPKPLQRDA
jgi:hypothetical protein